MTVSTQRLVLSKWRKISQRAENTLWAEWPGEWRAKKAIVGLHRIPRQYTFDCSLQQWCLLVIMHQPQQPAASQCQSFYSMRGSTELDRAAAAFNLTNGPHRVCWRIDSVHCAARGDLVGSCSTTTTTTTTITTSISSISTSSLTSDWPPFAHMLHTHRQRYCAKWGRSRENSLDHL